MYYRSLSFVAYLLLFVQRAGLLFKRIPILVSVEILDISPFNDPFVFSFHSLLIFRTGHLLFTFDCSTFKCSCIY